MVVPDIRLVLLQSLARLFKHVLCELGLNRILSHFVQTLHLTIINQFRLHHQALRDLLICKSALGQEVLASEHVAV